MKTSLELIKTIRLKLMLPEQEQGDNMRDRDLLLLASPVLTSLADSVRAVNGSFYRETFMYPDSMVLPSHSAYSSVFIGDKKIQVRGRELVVSNDMKGSPGKVSYQRKPYELSLLSSQRGGEDSDSAVVDGIENGMILINTPPSFNSGDIVTVTTKDGGFLTDQIEERSEDFIRLKHNTPEIGDYVSPHNTSPVVDLPESLWPALVARTAGDAFRALGDKEGFALVMSGVKEAEQVALVGLKEQWGNLPDIQPQRW